MFANEEGYVIVVVSSLGGLSSPVYVAEAGRQVTLQTTLLGGSLT